MIRTTFNFGFVIVYGLMLRVLFGFWANIYEVMSLTFLALVPVIVGFLTIALTPRESTINRGVAFFKPWITCLILLVITIALNIEGTICWVMIFPFFAVAAGIGGVIAFSFLKRREEARRPKRDDILDDFDSSDRLQMSLLLLAPLILGIVEGDRTQRCENLNLVQSVEIEASTAQVWQVLTQVGDIEATEKHSNFCAWIGFPRHLRTTLDTAAVGSRRLAIYEKDLIFEETIHEIEPERLLRLQLFVDPKKVPPTTLDEHVVIGGKYLDVQEDVYRLSDSGGGRCRLEVSTRFWISTPLNWYVGWWAELLIGDIQKNMLALIETRSTGY